MKKRSLVAAVAMLVVSAIVLTSATYAWFAASSTASVGTMSTAVANNDGSLQVKATISAAGTPAWKTALTAADYSGYATTLTPVSMSIANVADGPSFYKVAYDGVSFSVAEDTNGTATDFMTYGFDVQYVNAAGGAAKTFKIVPTWADTSNFCYALIKVECGSTTKYYMLGGNSYVPVTAIAAGTTITDGKGESAAVDIIDSADTNHTNATMGSISSDVNQIASSANTVTFNAAAGGESGVTTTASVTVWIWAEGQDAQCSGTTAAGAASLTFAIVPSES